MRKTFWSICVLLCVTVCLGCSAAENTPEGVVQEFYKLKAANRPDEVWALYSDYVKKELKVEEAAFREEKRRGFDDLRFKGYKSQDLRFTGKEDLRDGMILLSVEERYSLKTDNKDKIFSENIVVINENGKWKLNGYYFKKHEMGHKCGVAGGMEICIDKVLVFTNGTEVSGTIENKGNDRYRLGFSSPSGYALTTDKGELIKGDTLEWGKTEIGPGHKGPVSFVFGSKSDPAIIKGKPAKFQLDRIIKMGGTGLPAGFGEGATIEIPLAQ